MTEAKEMTSEELSDRICALLEEWQEHKDGMVQADELGDKEGKRTHHQRALRAIGEAFRLTKESERRKRCRI